MFGSVEGADDVAFRATLHLDRMEETAAGVLVAECSTGVDLRLRYFGCTGDDGARDVLTRGGTIRDTIAVDTPGKSVSRGGREVGKVATLKVGLRTENIVARFELSGGEEVGGVCEKGKSGGKGSDDGEEQRTGERGSCDAHHC